MIAGQPIIDCHAHIIDPARFPFDNGPGYRPLDHEVGPREAYSALLDRHGVRHALLVQPSCYGFDNSAMLDAVANEPGKYRAIAMVDPNVSERTLLDLAAGGVVGVRFNLVSYDRAALSRPGAVRFLERLKAFSWFAEVLAYDEQWPEIANTLLRSGVSVLIDHFGIRNVTGGTDQPGFQAVLALGREGLAVVKLTTPFVFSNTLKSHHELDPIVAALVDAFGIERCIWGSDWPFLDVQDPPDYSETAMLLPGWLQDPADRKQVLWRNPIRLFGFGADSHG
jgi:predicted TIM-barrel fold metal-dependent hydrolase